MIKLVGGHFRENETVTIEVGGKLYNRKVYWDNQTKDLYFLFKGYKYFFYDFWSDAPVQLCNVLY